MHLDRRLRVAAKVEHHQAEEVEEAVVLPCLAWAVGEVVVEAFRRMGSGSLDGSKLSVKRVRLI